MILHDNDMFKTTAEKFSGFLVVTTEWTHASLGKDSVTLEREDLIKMLAILDDKEGM